MANWRVARSLDELLAQFNAKYPARSKASDGSIGDAAHASRSSDHNPWYGPGIVTARDFTHDPAHGMDMNRLSAELVATRDRRIKYVIWNRRIIDSRPGSNPWKWMPYNGTNPHDHHMHVSVMDNASCDDASPWHLASFGAAPVPPAPIPPVEDDMFTDADRKVLNENNAYLKAIYEQLAGAGAVLGTFTGWPSFEHGTPELKATLVDYARHCDEQMHALLTALTEAQAGTQA